jgi:SAM-dependent methyltransferase
MDLTINSFNDLIILSHFSELNHVFNFCLKQNIYTHIDNGIEINKLSEKIKCEKRLLLLILNILKMLNLVEIDGEIVKNTHLTSSCLNSKFNNNFLDYFCYLGKGSEDKSKSIIIENDVNDNNMINELELERNALDKSNRYTALKLAKFFMNKNIDTILDIGTGSGIFIKMFLKFRKNINAHCIDKAETLNLLKKSIEEKSFLDRITFIPGDLRTVDIGNNLYDIVLLSNILHFFNKNEIIEIIKKVYLSLKKGGIIIINDFFINYSNPMSLLFSLQWLTNGVLFIELKEIKKILKRTGFNNINRIDDEKINTDILYSKKN